MNTGFPTFFPVAVLATLGALGAPAQATVTLPALLSDHAVLQRSAATRIWGKAAPAEAVAVTLGDAQGKTTADGQGHWEVKLDLSKAKDGPFDLNVTGTNTLVVHDVLVGEVWLASGQSNMESPIRRTDTTEAEIAQANDPQMRHFKVRNTALDHPADDVVGTWMVDNPENMGSFSGVAYYFAKHLRESLGVPVGIINSSWGGTPIAPWISQEGIDSIPELKAGAEKTSQAAADYPAAKAAYAAAFQDWAAKNNRTDHPPADASAFAGVSVPETDWKTVNWPGKIAGDGLPPAGAYWLRKTVQVPAANAGKGVLLSLGIPHGFETVYLNGKEIGSITAATGSANPGHHDFSVTGDELTAGPAVIAVRIYDPVGPLEVEGAPALTIYPALPLSGPWLAKSEYALPAPTPEEVQNYPKAPLPPPPGQDRPAFLYNAMIDPVMPDTFKGVIWYQGESNVGSGF